MKEKIPKCPMCNTKMENVTMVMQGVEDTPMGVWVCPKHELYEIAMEKFKKKWGFIDETNSGK